MRCDRWGEMKLLSKCLLHSSYGLGVKVCSIFNILEKCKYFKGFCQHFHGIYENIIKILNMVLKPHVRGYSQAKHFNNFFYWFVCYVDITLSELSS